MTPRRALVTGAAGFVGANLVPRLLADGHDVRAAVRPGGSTWRLDGVDVERVELELRDEEAVSRALRGLRPEWVFHLAAFGAYSWQTDRRRIFETNLLATLSLLAAADGAEAFVQAGTSSEYGFRQDAPSEHEAPKPNSDYAVSKAAATLAAGEFARREGRRVATLRLYSVYGPWEEPERLVPTLIRQGLYGRLPPLVAPDTARDFVHVDDVCDAFVRAATRDVEPDAIFNVGTGVQTTISDAVEVARRALGIDEEPSWSSMPNRAWDTAVWVADASRARAELGWAPQHSFEDGFAATVAWVRDEAPSRYREPG